MTSTFHYSVFGLHVESALALPELEPAEPGGVPDVLVTLGEAPRNELGPGAHVTDGGLLVTIDGVGRYFVAGGSRILVEPEPGAPAAKVRLFLLGSAMGAVMHQRGLLPLHANAVEIGGRAFAFMGKSGVGKSTLAACFHDFGHQVISDDVCVVRFGEDGAATVSPGLPRLRLWKEALEATGRDSELYRRSFTGSGQIDKYDVPIAGTGGRASCVLGAIYVLAAADRFEVEQLSGVDAVQAVVENTYRGKFARSLGQAPAHLGACMKLVARTPVYRVRRTQRFERLEPEARALAEHAAGLLADLG